MMNDIYFKLISESVNIRFNSLQESLLEDGEETPNPAEPDFADSMKQVKANLNNDERAATESAKNLVARVMKWYYKVEPNKKFKLLRKVLKVFNWIVYQFYSKLMMNGIINNAIASDKKSTTGKAAAISGGLIVGTGLGTAVITRAALNAAIGTKLVLNLSGFIGKLISVAISSAVRTALVWNSVKQEYVMNIKDYDANMEQLKKTKELLEKGNANKSDIKKVDDAIAELEAAKNKWDKLKKSNISARGKIERNTENADKKQLVNECCDAIVKAAILGDFDSVISLGRVFD